MRKRVKFLLPIGAIITILAVLMVNMSSAMVFFYTPAEMKALEPGDIRMRLAGQVVAESVVEKEKTVVFTVVDCDITVPVIHTGNPPQLFSEGIGVILEGTWNGTEFISDTMFVMHDEQYRADPMDYDPDLHACVVQ